MKNDPTDPKHQSLLEHGTLHAHPESVLDARFTSEQDFFDPRDLLQVKYEMLRKVIVDNEPVSHAARDFGFSRVSFYKMLHAFEQHGLAGLLPRKRGPRGGHKVTDEVIDFLSERRAVEPDLDASSLAELVEERFDQTVHPRSIERALTRKKKTLKNPTVVVTDQTTVDAYEALREPPGESTGWGRALLIHRGMVAWIRACATLPVEARARTRHTPPTSPDRRPPPSACAGVERELAEIVTSMVLAAGVVVR